MCLFIQNFSSTEFNSFPSAQQCLCGLGAKTRPLASFYKIEWLLFRGRGALEAVWEGAAGKKGTSGLEAGRDVRGSPSRAALRRSRRAIPTGATGFCYSQGRCEGRIQLLEM